MRALSDKAIDAIFEATVTRGKRKGSLKANAPRSSTMAYAAWQGAMLSINPYKASIGGLMFMSAEQRAVCAEVTAFFDENPQLRFADRDRRALESLGVW